MFADRKPDAAEFWNELRAIADRIDSNGEFEKADKREIAFLDTADHTIRLNGFVLRQRIDLEKDGTEYNLKFRSPDRYVEAGADVRSAPARDGDVKFEEYVGPPYVSRFSHSNSIDGPRDEPATLGQAAKLFPVLGKLKRDGQRCPDELELREVNSLRAYERALKGASVNFAGTPAELSLILWSDGKDGRPLVAEFSFRYKHDEKSSSPEVASQAMDFFEEVQLLDWCRPGARTKTQYVYREE